MRTQTENALAEADLALLVFDARAGITPLDEHFARWLRRSGKAVALVANKCEGREAEAGLGEAYALRLGQAIPVSAEHGIGMSDLYEAIAAVAAEVETLDGHAAPATGVEGEAAEEEADGDRVQPRPTVGRRTEGQRVRQE